LRHRPAFDVAEELNAASVADRVELLVPDGVHPDRMPVQSHMSGNRLSDVACADNGDRSHSLFLSFETISRSSMREPRVSEPVHPAQAEFRWRTRGLRTPSTR